MHEPALCNSDQNLNLIFDTVILCLGSCCSAGRPFRQLGLNTSATRGLAELPLENPHKINNLLKREAQIHFSCQRSNCLIQEFKILCRALRCCLKNKATVPNKEGCVPVCA